MRNARGGRRSSVVAAVALACLAGPVGGGTALAAAYPYTAADPRVGPGGCAVSGELPWVGNADPVLSVRVAGEGAAGDLPEVRFRLWREGAEGTPVTDAAVPTLAGSTATLQVPKENVPEEGPYWWQARVESADGVSAWTAPCGFRTDHTAPATPAVTFLDGETYPSGAAPAGTVRTVRVSVPAGTEAAHFCLSPVSAEDTSECPAERRIAVGADGSATTAFVTPEGSGPAQFWARAYDRAGNSWSAGYADYWITSPFPQPSGDHDGDGRPDLLGVDAEGRLALLAGREGGGFAAPVTVDGRDWAHARVARAGHLINRYGPQEPNDVRNDIVALRDGKLYAYPGDGAGGFGAAVEITGYDWSGVTSLDVTRGNAEPPRILAVRDGRLLFFDVFTDAGGTLRVDEPVVLAGSGWETKEVVASGAEAGAVVATFWARDTRAGTLEFAGVDYGTDAPYALVARVRVAESGWDGRRVRAVVPAGDLSGDGVVDLVTADRFGRLAVRVVGSGGVPGGAVAAGGVPAGLRLF
ncbi:hypothetical protein [Streptomyces sp.]|uniref:hypothetical protein n=2 Tax=Streptomyces sp. TaxID=1931 RepID=UPI002811BE9B|nr:hypothetical protein [Streptomyces sp.]